MPSGSPLSSSHGPRVYTPRREQMALACHLTLLRESAAILPLPTRVLLAASDGLRQLWWLFALGLALDLWGGDRLRRFRRPEVRLPAKLAQAVAQQVLQTG